MNADRRSPTPLLLRPRVAGFLCGVILLATAGCAGPFRELGERINGTPRKKAALLQSPRPDDRREAVLFFVDHDYGREEKYTRLYREMATQDPDPLVRATAVRALNRSRDRQATQVFVSALGDEHPLVRLEGAKALNRLPDPAAAPALLRVVNSPEESRDVRIAAAEALQHYRTVDVARQLVPLLTQKDFSVAWQARRSLRYMTGKDMAYDEGAWLQYITGPTKPLG